MQAPGAWKLGQFSQKKYIWPHKLVSPFMSDPREGTKYIGITGERQNWRKVHLQILNCLCFDNAHISNESAKFPP